MYKEKKEMVKLDEYMEFNIGSLGRLKIVKIGKGTSSEERKEIQDLIREYINVFAWSYDDLKAQKGDIIQHTIPLKEDAKPFQQKLRHTNPKLAPLIQKELQKLLSTNIIAPTRHSTWVSNLLVLRKKTCKIRLCVDFRNLNVSYEKDNYLFPYMEHLSQRITRFPMMSLLDGFLGYNQMSVNKDD